METDYVTHVLAELPYPVDALAPYMSAETLEYHYGKHHAAYVAKLNELLVGHKWSDLPLVELIRKAHATPGAEIIFNNAAQHWNHAQFWNGMRPKGGGAIPGELERALIAAFGSVQAFRTDFVKAGLAQFGSGWVWLVLRGDGLEITKTSNADNPLTTDAVPLIGCDVWEHAYYIDYRNRRLGFLNAYLDHLVDWDMAARLYATA
jgi:Fe-Mn family superoxide dismutase